jgi:hypothetical protein
MRATLTGGAALDDRQELGIEPRDRRWCLLNRPLLRRSLRDRCGQNGRGNLVLNRHGGTSHSYRLIAVLSNTYREDEEEVEVDQIIGDNATLPNDDLYVALKPLSRNLGEVDLTAMVEGSRSASLRIPKVGSRFTASVMHGLRATSMRRCSMR